ncbi:Reverse transcriptase, partial [Phytophthora palmivora]
MASGFWVVSMTERARKISAFITPFGLFEWTCMPFGLKNAPQIYQHLIDNALYGHLRIGPGQDSSRTTDYWEGDILVTAPSWDDLCEKVEKLLNACDKWNLSISVVKSFWGLRKVAYLGHQVSAEGLEASPKDLEALGNLPFPRTLRSMQSFLGSLNYYRRFIEDFAVYAAVLYELREVDFHEIRRKEKISMSARGTGGELVPEDGDDRWTQAKVAFTMLKAKIVSTPVLRHFDPDRTPVVVLYASKWAISAALMQEHDGVYWPVTFTSRTLKPNEINYGMVDKEVLALLRMLDVCYTQLVTRPIKVLSRYSTLAWLLNSTGFDGRLGEWAALLSGWTLEVTRCTKGEEEILGVIAASITPRAEVDEALLAIAPKKRPRQTAVLLPPTVEPDEELLVVSFDGSARTKRKGGAYSAIVWKLPEWTIMEAMSEYMTDLTVNEAEYRGLLLCLELLSSLDRGRVGICADSNLVIRQMRGEIECKAPGLQLLRQKAMDRLQAWPKHEFLHVKREWNQSADRLASAALQRQEGEIVTSAEDHEDLITLNRLGELLFAHLSAITRSTRARRSQPKVLEEPMVQRMRCTRIRQAQEEEKWIADLKAYLNGDGKNLAPADAKSCAKIASDYEVDENDLLFFCPKTVQRDEDRDAVIRLVVPESLQQDFLHHYHASLEGGHQGIGRTYLRIRAHFHWQGLYRSVQKYVGECTYCETGKGRPFVQGESPGNIQATYPFQVISMDHIPTLPRSFKGNTELLIWADLFIGYVVAKASSSREAQTIAENYEECVFRRFGASEVIRHDREPGFMADFFRAVNRMVKMKQSATMAYRPQANGKAERTVQTLTRALKMYVSDVSQQDWDDYAERLTFALNTAQDTVRGDTAFYLVHGWDPRSTLEAVIPFGSTRRRD